MKVITLTTDFGHTEYVAQMKGVIHGIAPEARVVDISHDIAFHDIVEGAFVLMASAPYFKDAIHVAVVDPGVGTDRRPLVIECQGAVLVGPDNGLLMPAARRLGLKDCYEITNDDLLLPEISATFHGRDIFAPVAAHMAMGLEPRMVGHPVDKGDLVDLDIEVYDLLRSGVKGMVVRTDRFGNVITNIPAKDFATFLVEGSQLHIDIAERSFEARAVRTYGNAKTDELVVLISSSGHIEIGVRQGSAKERLGASTGDRITIGF